MTGAQAPTPARRPIGRWARLGTILMVSSLPIWPLLLLVPFLPLGLAARGAVATGMVVLAEILFWGGAALAGPEAARRVRSWWRRPSRTSAARAGSHDADAVDAPLREQ